MLRPYKSGRNPRTGLKAGHYTENPRAGRMPALQRLCLEERTYRTWEEESSSSRQKAEKKQIPHPVQKANGIRNDIFVLPRIGKARA